MSKDIHLSMRSSCIPRDIFGFHVNSSEDKDDMNIIVDRYVQTISPISAIETRSLNNKGMDIALSNALSGKRSENVPNFKKRNFRLDLEKRVFDYLFECQSDYLITDTAGCRFDIVKFFDGSHEISITADPWFISTIKELKREGYIYYDDYRVIKSDEEVIALLDKYLPIYYNKMLERYPVDKIIFVDVRPTIFYMTDNKNFIGEYNRELRESNARRIAFGLEKTKEILKGCHVIPFLDFAVGDLKHKWGPHSMHYTIEYYQYGYEAMKVILCGNYDRATEERKLLELKEKYSQIYYDRYSGVISDGVELMRRKIAEKEKYAKYTEYLKRFIINNNTDNVVNYFKKHNYTHCAFYGYTHISKVYIEILKKYGITIDYIIENNMANINNIIPVVRRDAESYPKTDVIIIADINGIDKIKEKLDAKTPIPHTDVYEILN